MTEVRTVLISIFVLGFSTGPVRCEKNIFSLVGKCCPAEEVLWTTSKGFKCMLPRTNHTNRLLYYGYNNKPMFPDCKLVKSTVINNEIIPIRVHCLDMLFDSKHKLEEGRLVGLMCDDDETTIYTHSVIPRNHIVRVRTCCPAGQHYDYPSRTCRPGQDHPLTAYFHRFVQKKVDFVGVYHSPPYCNNPLIDFQINVTDVTFQNQSLLIYNKRLNQTLDAFTSYDLMCIDMTESPSIMVTRMCLDEKYCKNNACVRKCCPHDKIYQHPRCVPNNPVGSSNFHSTILNDMSLRFQEFKDNLEFSYDYGLKTSLQCEHGEQLVTEDWLLKSNGFVHNVNSDKVYTHDEYCIDLTDDTIEPDLNWILLICNETEFRAFNRSNVLVISFICLLVAIIYHSQFWTQQDITYKRLCVCLLITSFYTCCLFITTNVQSLVNLVKFEYIGHIVYFFMLSKTAWLTMMCWDTWKLAKSILKVESIYKNERAVFTFYCVIVWGSALNLVLQVMILTNLHLFKIITGEDANFDEKWLMPGNSYRIFSYVVPMLLYVTIITILLVLSIGIYHRVSSLRTAWVMHKTKLKVLKERLYINTCLYLVIGLPIMIEIFAKTSSVSHKMEDLSTQMVNFLDFLTCSEGISCMISLIVVPKIYNTILRQFTVQRSRNVVNNHQNYIIRNVTNDVNNNI